MPAKRNIQILKHLHLEILELVRINFQLLMLKPIVTITIPCNEPITAKAYHIFACWKLSWLDKSKIDVVVLGAM